MQQKCGPTYFHFQYWKQQSAIIVCLVKLSETKCESLEACAKFTMISFHRVVFVYYMEIIHIFQSDRLCFVEKQFWDNEKCFKGKISQNYGVGRKSDTYKVLISAFQHPLVLSFLSFRASRHENISSHSLVSPPSVVFCRERANLQNELLVG